MDRPPSHPWAGARAGATPEQDATAATVLVLRVVTGAYEGSEYPLLPEREIVIGRSRDVDLALVGDERVSRRHALVAVRGEAFVVKDLGSTNGTFVNGDRVTEVEVGDGDRVEVGATTMRVVTVVRRDSSEDGARRRMEEIAELRSTRRQSLMHGALDEVPLPQLLQLMAPSRRTAMVRLERAERGGRVCVRRGQVCHASLDHDWSTPPLEALYELLGWTSGSFEVGPDDGEIFAEEITLPLETLLLESMSRLDEGFEDESSEPTVELDLLNRGS